MSILWRLRWQCKKRHKEGKMLGYFKTHFSFQHLVLLHGANFLGVNPEQLSTSTSVWLAWKAAIQLFMVILLPYESAFSILSKVFLPRIQMETLVSSFLWVPLCVSQFLCVVTNGAKLPKWQLFIFTDCCKTPSISQQGPCNCLFPPFLSLAAGPCAVEWKKMIVFCLGSICHL